MKKNILSILLLAVSIFGLCLCGCDKTSETSTPDNSQSSEIEDDASVEEGIEEGLGKDIWG